MSLPKAALRPRSALTAACLTAALLPPGTAGAGEGLYGPRVPQVDDQKDAERGEPSRDGRRTLLRLPHNLARNVAGLVLPDNLVPLLGSAAVTAGSFALDDDVRDWFQEEEERLGGLHSFGDKLGDAEVVVPLTAGLFLAGRLAENQRFRDMTYDFAQAQIAAGLVGAGLKRAVGRERPNGSNDRSFPSGHSYSWFAAARIVDHHYGTLAALPAYGLWVLAAGSRLDNDSHYFSDAVAGAALGFLVARVAVRRNDEPLPGGPASPQLSIAPWTPTEEGFGVRVHLAF